MTGTVFTPQTDNDRRFGRGGGSDDQAVRLLLVPPSQSRAREALIRTVPLFDSQPDVWWLSVIRRWLFLVFSPHSLTLSQRTPPTPPIMAGLGGIVEER